MKKYFLGILLIVVSAIVITVGVFNVKNTSSANYEKITGTISRIDVDEYYNSREDRWEYQTQVFVDYTYNGKDYQNIELDYYDSFLMQGQEIDFYVNIKNPTEITINLAYKSIIFFAIGGAFLCAGIFIIVKVKKNNM